MELIAIGAEATLYRDGETVRKVRVSKGYRHPELDKELRRARTRREAKVLERLSRVGVPAPQLLKADDKKAELQITFLDGPKLRDVLNGDAEKYGKEMGALLGKLHAANIVHGDFTTSNVLVVDGKLHVIDFGLATFDQKAEGKAVDLHLMRQALHSAHYAVHESCWQAAIEGYKEANPDAEEVLKRLEGKVEKRGRHRQKKKKEAN